LFRKSSPHPPITPPANGWNNPAAARVMIRSVMEESQSWRGELPLDAGAGMSVPGKN
jgi:hypothetical protein